MKFVAVGDIEYVVEEENKKQELFIQGGPGSGFQGHHGRPGQVGGSKKGSGDKSLPKGKSGKKPNFVRSYHGTDAEVAERIAKEGIRKASGNHLGYGRGRPDSVYFTTDYEMAVSYGEGAGFEKTGEFAVIEFSIPREMGDQVEFDEVDAEEFGAENNYRIKADVPPGWITKIVLYDMDGNVVNKNALKSLESNIRIDKPCYSVVLIQSSKLFHPGGEGSGDFDNGKEDNRE